MSASPDPSRLSPVPPKAHSPQSPLAHQFEDPSETHGEPLEPHQAEDDGEDEIPYPEPSSEQTLLPPPNFNPFFTIVEDTTTGEHHHPFVHYVFADDDPVIVTAAAMRSLGLDDTKYLPQPEVEESEQQNEDEEGHEPDTLVESPLPPPPLGGKERFMIIDIAADGHTIVDAQSLSPDWQITNTAVRTAPSLSGGSPDQGYMLRIEGVEVPNKNKGKAKGQPGETKLKEAQDRSHGDTFGALDELVRGIEGSLDVAGKISGREEEVRASGGTVLRTEDVADTRRESQLG